MITPFLLRQPTAIIAVPALFLLFSASTHADCTEDINTLDSSYASAGYMLSDPSAVTTSGYLEQSRSLRDTAMILLSRGREEECVQVIAEAQRLADRASRPSVYSVEELIGREVHDPSGQSVGNLENVMIDLDRGVVAYALVSFGGFLGIGEDLIPVPFGQLSQGSDSEALEISTSFQKIENAPRYFESDWDLTSRRSWATDVYNYYGEEIYWAGDRRANAIAGASVPSDSSSNSDSDQISSASSENGDTGSGDQSEDNVAGHEPLRGFGHLFKVLDSDESGDISLDESRREFAAFKRFLEIDADESGGLTEEEFMELVDTHRISKDGETIIPKAEDAKPEEKWTGGKESTEAAAN